MKQFIREKEGQCKKHHHRPQKNDQQILIGLVGSMAQNSGRRQDIVNVTVHVPHAAGRIIGSVDRNIIKGHRRIAFFNAVI
ncbi:MAG TPA: hypothetical protein IAC82_00330 [Candidatus Merdivicinus intestinigallinarum]|nr:hypothetical protein [Candidatus Merdivicinus intestinigallinarum]